MMTCLLVDQVRPGREYLNVPITAFHQASAFLEGVNDNRITDMIERRLAGTLSCSSKRNSLPHRTDLCDDIFNNFRDHLFSNEEIEDPDKDPRFKHLKHLLDATSPENRAAFEAEVMEEVTYLEACAKDARRQLNMLKGFTGRRGAL